MYLWMINSKIALNFFILVLYSKQSFFILFTRTDFVLQIISNLTKYIHSENSFDRAKPLG